MDLEKMKQEEAELDKLMFGEANGSNPSVDEEATPSDAGLDFGDTVETVDLEDEVDEPIQEEVAEPVQSTPKRKRIPWKQRFTGMKTSYDNLKIDFNRAVAQHNVEIQELRSEKDELLRRINEMMSEKNKAASEEVYETVFTAEDEETLGPEAIAIMKRAMKTLGTKGTENSEISSVKNELAQLRKEREEAARRELQRAETDSREVLKQRIAKAVPDWRTIDHEQGFAEFMGEVDPLSGIVRSNLMHKSILSGDVERIAKFYTDYKSLKPATREDILGQHVTPTGTAAGTNPTESKVPVMYRMSEYNKFMNDVNKGRYNRTPEQRKEARIIEARFDKAFMEGRMIED